MNKPSDKLWWTEFLDVLTTERQMAENLRTAALAVELGRWTFVLTQIVVASFGRLGMPAVAKGNRVPVLPVGRGEYLGQDVMAFSAGDGTGWRFPSAVCELENSPRADRVAYSLWKVLCVRCSLRVVFCYRREWSEAAPLIDYLVGSVVAALPTRERIGLSGSALVVIGSRSEASAFPYAFFRAWKLNTNTGYFESFARL